jgi:beta-galactosidase
MERSGGRVVVRGRGFDCTFDERTGTLASLRLGGTELLAEGPRGNVWRAPLANERDAWGVFRGRLATHREGMGDDVANGWRAIGLDRLEHTVTRFSARQVSGRGRGRRARWHSRSSRHGLRLRPSQYLYRVLGTGEIVCGSIVARRMPVAPVGLQWFREDGAPPGRRGPYETYPDRKTGARVELYEVGRGPGRPTSSPGPRARPTSVGGAAARTGSLLVSGDGLLNVSAQRYTTDNLSRRPTAATRPDRTVT